MSYWHVKKKMRVQEIRIPKKIVISTAGVKDVGARNIGKWCETRENFAAGWGKDVGRGCS